MKLSILGGIFFLELFNVIGIESVQIITGLSKHNMLFYDSTYGIFCVANHEKHLGLSTNANFTLISNCTENVYMLIDMKTRQVVLEKMNVDFKKSDGSVDYSKLGKSLHSIFTKYEAITSKTPSSFNLDVLIKSFFNKEFDLKKILDDSTIADRLNSAFGHWLQDVEKHYTNNGENIESIWDLLSTVPQLGRNINNALIKIIKHLYTYLGNMEPLIILEVIQIIRDEAQSIMVFAEKFANYLATTLNKTIQSVVHFIKDPNTNPITFNVTTNETAYYVSGYKIDSAYVLRYSSFSETGKRIAVKVVYINSTLLFVNENDKIVLALYNDVFDLINLNTHNFIHGTISENITIKILSNHKLINNILQEQYTAVVDDTAAQIVEANNDGQKGFSLARFYRAMKSSSQSIASEKLGEPVDDDIWKYYHTFFMHMQEDGMFGLILGVFGDQQSYLLQTMTKFTSIIASTTKNYGIITEYLPSLVKSMFG